MAGTKIKLQYRKTFVGFFLILATVFSAGCNSSRIPCPKLNKSAKKGIKDSKIEGAEDQAKTAVSIGGIKNEKDKNGLIKKSKYKKLRNRPDRKVTKGNKKSIFNVFSKN